MPTTLLEQREIEAKIVAPLIRAVAAEIGEERALAILARVVHDLAVEAGGRSAEALGGNNLTHLGTAIQTWKAGEALELEVSREDSEALEFNVTRCRYAEMYHRLGLADLGPILSCGRDAAMIEGFNPAVVFQRTHTLMEGATHCDFRYKKTASGLTD